MGVEVEMADDRGLDGQDQHHQRRVYQKPPLSPSTSHTRPPVSSKSWELRSAKPGSQLPT